MYTYVFGYINGRKAGTIKIHANSEDEAWDIIDTMNLRCPQLLYKKEA